MSDLPGPHESTNAEWQLKLDELLAHGREAAPRGKETREQIAGQYTVPMPSYVSLKSRGVNLPFLLAEPAWILAGSNRASELTPFMKAYANFSDDGIFLAGAYGPKVVDQFGYVVESLAADPDSRQAYMNIWRERPRGAKDIACTTGMQFLVRDDRLNMVVTMRSQDIVQGFTYDVFTFSCVANAVRLLLKAHGEEHPLGGKREYELGDLTVTAGSLHLYRDPFEKGDDQFMKARTLWSQAVEEDEVIHRAVAVVMQAGTFEEFVHVLREEAELCRALLSQSK